MPIMIRREIDPEDLTQEDRDIWLSLVGPGGRLYALLALWGMSAGSDERDARSMLYIENQASYARRQDKRFGRGGRFRGAHPLARIGMWL